MIVVILCGLFFKIVLADKIVSLELCGVESSGDLS